jgi:hypothetical protein
MRSGETYLEDKGRDHVVKVDVVGRVILKCILNT